MIRVTRRPPVRWPAASGGSAVAALTLGKLQGGAVRSLHLRDGSIQVRDEVCGMEFPIEQATTRTRLKGRSYYFCSVRCKWLFLTHPGWYVPVEAGGVPESRLTSQRR